MVGQAFKKLRENCVHDRYLNAMEKLMNDHYDARILQMDKTRVSRILQVCFNDWKNYQLKRQKMKTMAHRLCNIQLHFAFQYLKKQVQRLKLLEQNQIHQNDLNNLSQRHRNTFQYLKKQVLQHVIQDLMDEKKSNVIEHLKKQTDQLNQNQNLVCMSRIFSHWQHSCWIKQKQRQEVSTQILECKIQELDQNQHQVVQYHREQMQQNYFTQIEAMNLRFIKLYMFQLWSERARTRKAFQRFRTKQSIFQQWINHTWKVLKTSSQTTGHRNFRRKDTCERAADQEGIMMTKQKIIRLSRTFDAWKSAI